MFQFYTNFGEALISQFVYLLLLNIIILKTSLVRTFVARLVLGPLLAYCTGFLKLAALLWVTTDTTFL